MGAAAVTERGAPREVGGVLPEVTTGRAARIAGIGYLAIFFLAIFANFVVFEGLVDPDDARATFEDVGDSEGLFRAGLVAFLAIFVIDVVVAWALYLVFRPQQRDLSLVSAWLRLTYTVFLGVALVYFFQALQYVDGGGSLAAFDADQLAAQTAVALDSFEYVWLIGLVAFGAHLMVMGRLIVRSGVASPILGHVLTVAGAAYVIDTVAHGVLSDYESVEGVFLTLVVIPSVVGELWLTFWLLKRGSRQAD